MLLVSGDVQRLENLMGMDNSEGIAGGRGL